MDRIGPRAVNRRVIWLVLTIGFAVRAVYVFLQPAFDPAFERPMLDGDLYLEIAERILSGGPLADGVFYLAPGYPLVLAAILALSGGSLTAVYLIQHAAIIVAAGSLARVTGRIGGTAAALATAILVAGYHPLLFYASRPLAESLGVALVAVSLAAVTSCSRRSALFAGALGVLATLFRPNFLPLVPLWAVRRWRISRTAAVVLMMSGLVVVAPVTLRNLIASGHLVPVSGNAGLTLYQGNGPGARGVYTAPAGFSGGIKDQRDTATAIASRMSETDLDPVEADRWWGHRALRARVDDPVGTLRLLGRRAMLIAGSREISVDYAPEIDANPARFLAPLSFAVLFALAVGGVSARGWRGTGGYEVWSAIAVTSIAPLVFYFSSRYRLPLAAMLCIPAGIGAAASYEAMRKRTAHVAPIVLGLVAFAVSWIPIGGAAADEAKAAAFANRGSLWNERGNIVRAVRDLESALSMEPGHVVAWYNLGVVRRGAGDVAGAIAAWSRALEEDPGHVESAANLASLLVRSGRSEEAIDRLRRALRSRPDHAPAWTNLVVAFATAGRPTDALDAVHEAARRGVPVPEELRRTIEDAAVEAVEEDRR